MSKPVYKKMMEHCSALADLYIAQANLFAEAAKEPTPFPDIASEPAIEPATEKEEGAAEHPTEVAPAAPAASAAPAPEPATSAPAAPAAPASVVPPATLGDDGTAEERSAAGVIVMQGIQEFGIPFVREQLQPHFGVDNLLTAPIECVRALSHHLQAELQKRDAQKAAAATPPAAQ